MADNKNKIDIVVVVSGQPQRLEVNVHQMLEQVAHKALQQSGNKGQDPSAWELRTEAGNLLQLSLTVAAAQLRDGITLFLSPKAGAGG